MIKITKILELARKNLIKAPSTATFQEICSLMLDHSVGSVVIEDGPNIIGFIDERTILGIIAAGNNPVKEKIMKYYKKFPILHKDLSVLDAWEKIKHDHQHERYGIVDDDKKIIGIIRKRTINDFRIRILKEELNIMED